MAAALSALPYAWPGAAAAPIALVPHGHSALFGYAAAVLAGFLLTALPNWTGRPPAPAPLRRSLLGLWLLGRVAPLGTAEAAALAPFTDAALASLLALTAAVYVGLSRNAKNVKTALVLAVYAGAAWWAAFRIGADLDPGPALRAGVASVVGLIVIIGGRMTPGFTKAWLLARGRCDLPVWFGRLDLLANVATAAALAAWVVAPAGAVTAAVLLAAAYLQAARLARWRGTAVLSVPELLGLHGGYAFVPLGLGAAALAAVAPNAVALDAPLHAWTVGAFGTTACAVMSRAVEGHFGAPRHARTFLWVALGCIGAAGVLRLGAGAWDAAPFLVLSAGALWTAGHLAFLAGYGPTLVSRGRAPF